VRARALLAVSTAIAALVLAAAPSAGAKSFSLGVAAGEVTSSSALLWAHAAESAKIKLQLSADRKFGNRDDRFKSVTPKAADDNTVTVRVTHLRPGHVYIYRFRRGNDPSLTGRFVTAPKPSARKTIRFAYSGDADAQPAAGQTQPFYNNFEVYARMAKEKNDFNVNLGDTIYSDSTVGADVSGGEFHSHVPPALTVPQKWQKYRMNLSLANLQKVRAATGMYNQWDDHEFIDDFARSVNGETLYQSGVQAFGDYMPSSYTAKDGLYRSFRWGRNLEVFLPDEISFRSAKAGAAGDCDNPDTGNPDVAPTLPQSYRDVFGAIYPPLKRPVAPACLAKINDPNRTMLGTAQLARFQNDLKRSKAKWKIVLNEDPISQTYLFPLDQWEGYAAERLKLLNFIKGNVKNVVFLTTDAHWTYFSDVRFKTLESGGPVESGIKELVTGPVAVLTWGRTINALLGSESGAANIGAIYRGAPPSGIGLQCSSLLSFSYAQVKVTSKELTLTPKTSSGKPVRETTKDGDTGPQCGPYKIKAK
jgi:phosphodiesterase/alkaline phosphatase D-like protein